MRGNRIRADLIIVGFVAALSFLGMGGAIRESDQASLLDGALRMARGEMPIFGASAYNYDKLFVSYWMVAAVLGGASVAGVEIGFANVGLVGNLAGAIVFWSGAIALLVRRGTRSGPALALMGAALAAPVVLLSVPVLSANMISGGMLLWLAALVGGKDPGGRGALIAAGVLSFLAVGARADAVLCLPFLCWVTERRASFEGLFASRRIRAMGAGAVAALVLGFAISAAPLTYAYPPMDRIAVVAAYLLFGMGGALAAYAAVFVLIGVAGWRSKRKLFYVAGGFFALLPLAYYGWQLYTPRHLLGCSWILLFCATQWRAEAILRGAQIRANGAMKGFAWGLGAAAVLPILVGLHLPEPNRPSIVGRGATLYPSADGLWPMGGSLDFLGRLGDAADEPIDHNQDLWRALESTVFETDADGFVPVLVTPLLSYFRLAATLRGMRVLPVGPGRYEEADFFFGEERVLLRAAETGWAGADPGSRREALSKMAKVRVSKPGRPSAVLRFGEGASEKEVERNLALAGVFRGNEFAVLGEVSELWPVGEREGEGRTVVFFSEAPFEIEVRGGTGEAVARASELEYAVVGGEAGRMFFVRAEGARTRGARYSMIVEKGAAVYAARQVLPDYMSVSEF